jgi:SAM-dependent methyltransferase
MKLEEYRPAFTDIAPYYDTLMSFINYHAWVSYIEKILGLYSVTEKIILDLACGTGACLELWLERGYHVIGLDISLPMLYICRERLFHATKIPQGTIHLINGDIRNFVLARRVPVITCLYDSLNYLLSEADLVRCFKNVYDALDDHGLFIFDMNTVHSLREEWGNQTLHRQDEEIYSTWTNSFDTRTNVSSLRLTLNIKRNGREIVLKEFHQERGYPLSTVSTLLTQAGFHCRFFRHLTFVPAQESNIRVMGVAEKK